MFFQDFLLPFSCLPCFLKTSHEAVVFKMLVFKPQSLQLSPILLLRVLWQTFPPFLAPAYQSKAITASSTTYLELWFCFFNGKQCGLAASGPDFSQRPEILNCNSATCWWHCFPQLEKSINNTCLAGRG